jgi:hypothetical protein
VDGPFPRSPFTHLGNPWAVVPVVLLLVLQQYRAGTATLESLFQIKLPRGGSTALVTSSTGPGTAAVLGQQYHPWKICNIADFPGAVVLPWWPVVSGHYQEELLINWKFWACKRILERFLWFY